MWDLKIIDTDKSLYLALAEALERDIRLGILQPGDRLPTHRALAKKVGVTVTTVTRAYEEAEKRGLISAVVGRGTFVAADAGKIPYNLHEDVEKKLPIEMGILHPLYSGELPFRNALELLLKDSDMELNKLMQYVPPKGLLEHRQIGAEWVARFGVEADTDNIIIAAGAQQGIYCIFASVLDAGDRVAIDCLTYPGIKSAARRNNVRLESVGMDEQGMIPESLQALCLRHKIKAVYTVGGIQNPTNYRMSENRRIALSKIIQEQNLLLIEDDLYGFLSDTENETLSAHVPDHAIYISSLSKAFYIGLRIAFVKAPLHLTDKLAQAVVENQWMVSPLSAQLACKVITSGLANQIIKQKRAILEKRTDLFRRKFTDYDFSLRERSMFAWFQLPDSFSDSSSFEKLAAQYGLHVYSSDKFSIGTSPPPNFVRLSISSPETDALYEQGLDIFYDLLNSY